MPEEKFIPFSRPTISRGALKEVADCLKSGWLTTGPRAAKFEEMMREYFNAPHALACLNATMGLWMALKALELKPGDEVITSPMTFVATLNTIVLAGGKPVLVDVEPGTYNIDPKKLAAAITPKTRVLMPVHFAGCPCDLDTIYALAARYGLRVLEDCAHCIGAVYKGRRLGSFGDIQVFSFHPNKNMTTGEGGAVVTRDAKLAKSIELQRFHGIDKANGYARHSKVSGLGHYDVVEPALKSNFMDIQAALGIHQLAALEEFNQKRRDQAAYYYKKLRKVPGLTLPTPPAYEHLHAWHIFSPVVERGAKVDRDTLMVELKKRQIGTGLHYTACHLHSYYEKAGWKRGDFPEAERISDGVLSLPLCPLLKRSEQNRVIAAVREIMG